MTNDRQIHRLKNQWQASMTSFFRHYKKLPLKENDLLFKLKKKTIIFDDLNKVQKNIQLQNCFNSDNFKSSLFAKNR